MRSRCEDAASVLIRLPLLAMARVLAIELEIVRRGFAVAARPPYPFETICPMTADPPPKIVTKTTPAATKSDIWLAPKPDEPIAPALLETTAPIIGFPDPEILCVPDPVEVTHPIDGDPLPAAPDAAIPE